MEELNLIDLATGEYEVIIDNTRMNSLRTILKVYMAETEDMFAWKNIARSESLLDALTDTYCNSRDITALYDERYKFIEYVNVKYTGRVLELLDDNYAIAYYRILAEGEYDTDVDCDRPTKKMSEDAKARVIANFKTFMGDTETYQIDGFFKELKDILTESGEPIMDYRVRLRDVFMQTALEEYGDWGIKDDDYKYHKIPLSIMYSQQNMDVYFNTMKTMYERIG